MNNVVAFVPKQETAPHLSGKARCCACRHDWVAVTPVGTDWLECPECHLMKGRYIHAAIPQLGTDVWECGCGCDVFMVSRTAAYCVNCGSEQLF